jgi:hypothetical protein
MVRKIIRDLENKGPDTISLKGSEPASQPKKQTMELHVLDCSDIHKKKKVLTGKKGRRLKDIESKKKLQSDKQEKVYFLHIDPVQHYKYSQMGDLIRLAGAGLVIFLILNIINVYHRGINLKNEVVTAAYSGYQELLQAGNMAKQTDFTGAEQTFNHAANTFDSALNEIAFLNSHNDYFLTREKTVDSAQGLLDAAKSISLAGQNFSKGIENLRYLPSLFIAENTEQIASADSDPSQKQSLTDKLKTDLSYIKTATLQLDMARQQLDKVSPDVLPPGFRDKLFMVKDQISQLYEVLTSTQSKIPAILDMLGDRYPHRYLILLQNDTESRPTGGFIGSYIIADLNDGHITKFDFHDVYELDGQYYEKIEPPEDIASVSETWRMRDSNYSPDYTISAEKAAWFLQKQNGPSVDSVIAINQSFITDLLEITGPIQVSSLDAPLDANNFQIVLSYIIESKLSGEDAPKDVLRELIPAFQSKLFANLELEKFMEAILKGFNDKKIMLYSRHEDIQNLFDEFGASNRIHQTGAKDDYLNVITTSIGGNKSDRYIDQNIKHYTLIQHDGTVLNEVKITRSHTWNGKDLVEWQHILRTFGFSDLPSHIIDILGRGDNKSFIKVYVPKGSQLQDVIGINKEDVLVRTDEEINKTYFMFQMKVAPSTSEKVTISYTLPEKLSMHPADTYRFYAQNQPSFKAGYLEKKVYFKPGLQSYSLYPESFKLAEDGTLFYGSEFDEDLYLSALVGY